jgi:hypothetical protein
MDQKTTESLTKFRGNGVYFGPWEFHKSTDPQDEKLVLLD